MKRINVRSNEVEGISLGRIAGKGPWIHKLPAIIRRESSLVYV